MNKTLKSIGAVLAGMVAGIILSLATDQLLHMAGIFPPRGQPVGDGPLALATAYRTIYSVVGCWAWSYVRWARW